MAFDVNADLVDFERTENEYGPKLQFTVEGDTGSFERRIDNCEWKGETFHRNVHGNRWEIDRTPKAINAVERETGIEIPRDVLLPDDVAVNLEIPEDSMYIKLSDVDPGVVEILKNELSYEDSYYDRNKREEITYQEDVIYSEGIPIGLKSQVEDILDELGVPWSMPDFRTEPEWWQVDYEWNFPHDLRDYQKKAVSQTLQGSRVIQFPTGAGKTITALKTVEELGMPTLILVHKLDLLEQWMDEIRETLGVEPGVIQGDREQYRDITVAMIPTLANRIEDNPSMVVDNFDVVVADEVHHLDADTFEEVALHTNAYYRYGLSATVEEGTFKDSEMLKILGGIGPSGVKVSPEYLIENGFLAKPEFDWLYPKKIDGKKRDWDSWQDAYRAGIVEHEDRNVIIAEKADELIDEGRRPLVDVSRLEHGKRLLRRMDSGMERVMWDPEEEPPVEDPDIDPDSANEWPIPVIHDHDNVIAWDPGGSMTRAIRNAAENSDQTTMWLSGSDGGDTREIVLELFRSGEIDCVISTLLREGTDVPDLDAVILAGGGKSAIQLIQTVGRALRPSGSDTSKIIDCKDQGPYISNHMRERVRAMRDYYGDYFDRMPMGVNL